VLALPASTRDTVLMETPVSRAISRIFKRAAIRKTLNQIHGNIFTNDSDGFPGSSQMNWVFSEIFCRKLR
jgi:hypothetical protein